MNGNGCGRKWLWPNISYYPDIRIDGLNQISKTLTCDRLFLARYFKSSPSEYEAWELPIRPLVSVGLR